MSMWQSICRCGKYLFPSLIAGHVVYKSINIFVATAPDNTASVLKKRFLNYASVQYDDQIYMTPNDFLECILDQDREENDRKIIMNVDRIKLDTPYVRNSKGYLFTRMKDNGIISYSEYLLLMAALTKPDASFDIAFKMLDTDKNGQISNDEFQRIERIFANLETGNEMLKTIHKNVPTTLTVHFFGPDIETELNYDDYLNFIHNLRHEVLDTEFNQFTQGQSIMKEFDFARALLKFTFIKPEDYEIYLNRLSDYLDTIKIKRGITFDEFCAFNKFISNIDDFRLATHIFTLANKPISKGVFERGVRICTDTELNSYVIDIVFALFDENGDGELSHSEFISIMKSRLLRRSQAKQKKHKSFEKCVKHEIKNYH